MFHKENHPRLGEFIALVMKITHLTKSIICSHGKGGDTYGSFKKGRICI